MSLNGNSEIKLYTAQNDSCPILSVKVSPWKNNYKVPFDTIEITKAETAELEGCMTGARDTQTKKQDFALVGKYCAWIVFGYISGKISFDEASDKLWNTAKYCRSSHKLQSHLVEQWLFGFYLSNGRHTDFPFLSDKNISNVPLAKDYVAGDFINAFIDGDGNCLRENMFQAINCLTDFDCQKSPPYLSDAEKYGKAASAVIRSIFAKVFEERGRSFLVPCAKTFRTQCFPGLLCNSECERELEITYIPYSENNELSDFLGACIKYTDNLMRQGHGIRSKLAGFTLASEYRRLISDTIRAELPGFLPAPMKVGRKPKENKDRQKKTDYREDMPVTEPMDLNIDFAKAKKLEAESWKLAEMLAGDYGGTDISFKVYDKSDNDAEKEIPMQISNETSRLKAAKENIPEEWQEFSEALSEDERKLLCLVAAGCDASGFAKKRGGLLMGYADSINEKASDTYGDIILLTDGVKIGFIEDYEQELRDIFKDMYDTEVL